MKNAKKLILLWVRISTAWKVLTSNKHWFIVWLSTDELKQTFTGELETLHMTVHKLHIYNVKHLIKTCGKGLDEVDLMCDKATFEAEAELLRTAARKTQK